MSDPKSSNRPNQRKDQQQQWQNIANENNTWGRKWAFLKV